MTEISNKTVFYEREMRFACKNDLQVNTTLDEAKAIIRDAIATEKPFAVSNSGDGEAMVLQSLQGLYSQENLRSRKKFHSFFTKIWHLDPNPTIAIWEMCGPIIRGLIKSDMLALYPGIPESFVYFRPDYPNFKRCSYAQKFVDPNTLDEYLQGKDVRIFSRYGERLKVRVQSRTDSSVAVTTIPFNTPLKKIPEFYANIQDFPEPVVLWGGGGGTKDLGAYLRDKFGKTCIDLGSVIDAWAGELSRKAYFPGEPQGHLTIKD